MRNISIDSITETAVASFGGLPDARQRELVQGLVLLSAGRWTNLE